MRRLLRIEEAKQIERQDKHESYMQKQRRDLEIQDDIEDKMKEIRRNQKPNEWIRSQKIDFRMRHQIKLRLNNIGKLNDDIYKSNRSWQELIREERTLWKRVEEEEKAN